MMESAAAAPGSWPAVEALVDETWRVFRARFGTLVSVMALGTAATALSFAAPLLACALWQVYGWPPLWVWGAAWLAGLSAALWIGSWAQAALCDAALAPDARTSGAFARAWGKVASFSWVCLLYMVVVGGALFLLVLPGLYLAVALAFSPLICLEEGVGGFEALARSLTYSRGRCLGLAGRLALLGALGSLPSLIPLVGWLLGGLVAPLPLVGLCLLYRAARQRPEESARRWPLALALAGWLPAAWLAAAGVAQARALWPTVQQQARVAARHLDVARAQRVLDDMQSGRAGPATALAAIQVLQDAASAVSVSSGPVSGERPR